MEMKMIRISIVLILALTALLGAPASSRLYAAEKDPPETIVFDSKLGNVTFVHAEHVKREENKCETCHDKLFPQSREPINFKDGMHKPAAANKTACAACHVAEGKAFPTDGNCKKCHVK